MTTAGTTRWRRQPADAFRFLLAFVAFWLLAALALAEPDRVQRISAELVELLDELPTVVTSVLVGALQLAALVAPLALVVVAVRGRRREALVAACAVVVAAVLGGLVNRWLGDAVPADIVEQGREASWVTGSAFPSGAYLAAAAAGMTVLAPVLTTSWRRAAWWTVWVVAGARVLASAEAPVNLLATVVMGIAVGSATLVALGAPERRPSPQAVRDALGRAGLVVQSVEPVDDPTLHRPAYRAVTGERTLHVKIVGRDQRDADLLNRLIRSLRVKGVEDDRPVNPRPMVEREALNTFLAASAGASVPAVRALGESVEDGAYIAVDWCAGSTLDELDPDAIDDDLLDRVLAEVAALHRSRLAHRWLSLDHILVGADGEITLLDLRWADASADDGLLANDIVEIVVALATRVGAARAVAAAARHWSVDELATAMPRVQPLALSPSTRAAAKAQPGLLGAVLDHLQAVTGIERVELLEIERLTWQKAFTLVGTVFIGYILLGLAANWSEIWSSLRQANPLVLIPLLLLTIVGTVSGVMSLMGAVNVRLPFVQSTVMMYAQSFLNRFTPANAGGMAMRIRYLQRKGVDTVVAAGSVGLTSLASGVMQVVIGVMFLVWAGSNAPESGGSVSFPSASTILLIVVAVLVLGGIVYATRWGRRLWAKLRISVAKVWSELRHLARQPSKMGLLFGGAFLGKVVNIVMLWVSVQAVGGDVGFAALGAMYIVANTVASAAPTPGGVGAIEAALTAGLISLAVPGATAAAAVVLFRLVSYWFPIIPGYIALRYSERAGIV